MTLQQIFDYANSITDDNFAAIADAIDFFNEAQDIIARWDKIQAAPVEIELTTTHQVTLPVNFLQIHKCTINGSLYYPPEPPWNGVLTLPEAWTSGTVKLWYYKTPTILAASTMSQVPDVSVQYHRSIASYASKMFYLIDDDPEMREAFRNEFYVMISSMKTPPGITQRYFNF